MKKASKNRLTPRQQHLFGLQGSHLAFDVGVHLGTLGAVLMVLRQDLADLLHAAAEPLRVFVNQGSAVDLLADSGTDRKNALRRLRRAGGRLVLADSLFCHDPRSGLFEQPVLELV